MAQVRVAYWFRTDLRLHDSPALNYALSLKPEVLYPIWTWDPHYVYHARVSPNRWRYLIDSMNDLSNALRKLTHNGLLVLRGDPIVVLEQVLKEWQITHLVFEKDTDTYARKRDQRVTDMCESLGIQVVSKLGRTLYDPEKLTELNNGQAVMSISTVEKCAKKLGDPARPIDAPASMPGAGNLQLYSLQKVGTVVAEPDLNLEFRSSAGSVTAYDAIDGPNHDFAVPTLEELNISESLVTSPHRGGEQLALKVLSAYCSDRKKTATFEKPKTNPGAFLPPETTLLSPHLHFGTLSIRKFYWDVRDVVDAYKGASSPPVSLIGQLLFRDMYFAAQFGVSHYEQTRGNSHCRFIPWRLCNTYDEQGKMNGYDTSGPENEEAEVYFQRWQKGMTGFPWIDAIMRQLRRDGWIHHLARHSVACFLTRGHCYISWERGADVFESLLIDHETACNVGNWQWLSCTAFFSQFFRVYSPVAFGKKWDKSGALIREYCPELKDVPEKYIYEPWTMPIGVQKQANIRIVDYSMADAKNTYPKPMFDLKEKAKSALEGMKSSYAQHIMGDDARVPTGEARALIEGVQEQTKSPKKRKGDQSHLDFFAKKTKINEN